MKMRTKLSRNDCQTRLASATGLRELALSWNAKKSGAVIGEFRGPFFRLHTGKYHTNSFAPFFYGKLTEMDGGAVLEGGFRMNPLIQLFLLISLTFLLLFGLAAIIVPAQAHPVMGAGRGWFFLGLAGVAVLGLGLVLLGKWLGRGEQEVIHSYLKSTLEANDV
jgi:hypothetical protein